MKTILITFYLLLSTFLVFAQGNFKAENGALIWQKVYNIVEGANVNALSSQLENVSMTETVINGKIVEGYINYQKQNYKRMEMPIVIVGAFKATVTIEKKTDRYRVTVTNIQSETMKSFAYGKSPKQYLPIDNVFFNNKGKQRTSKGAKIAIRVMDVDFTDKFSLKKMDNDW